MSSLEKARRKLEKAGFTGQTLERAMELLERKNASIGRAPGQDGDQSGKNAVHGAVRGGDQNAGTGDQTGALAQGTVLKKNKMK